MIAVGRKKESRYSWLEVMRLLSAKWLECCERVFGLMVGFFLLGWFCAVWILGIGLKFAVTGLTWDGDFDL